LLFVADASPRRSDQATSRIVADECVIVSSERGFRVLGSVIVSSECGSFDDECVIVSSGRGFVDDECVIVSSGRGSAVSE
jgi:hypothetical protein